MLLHSIVEHGHYSFAHKFDTWQEAIVASYQPLLQQKIIDPCYIDAVIQCVEDYGPYIVLLPGIAMPHSTENALGAHQSAVSFMRVEEAVIFDATNPLESQARLFFSLVATNPEEHLSNIQNLMSIIENEALIEALYRCDSPQLLSTIVTKHHSC